MSNGVRPSQGVLIQKINEQKQYMSVKTHLKIIAGFIGAAFGITALAGAVQASVVAYEPFNYTNSIPNAAASTASGFTGNWTCGTTPSIAAGMNYTNLPVGNSSLSSTSGRQSENFLTPLSSGTKWISFLFNQTGNNGGNHCGVYFPNGGTGLFFGYGLNPIDPATGALRPGSILTFDTDHRDHRCQRDLIGEFIYGDLRCHSLSGRDQN
jgi:hypothetical protein